MPDSKICVTLRFSIVNVSCRFSLHGAMGPYSLRTSRSSQCAAIRQAGSRGAATSGLDNDKSVEEDRKYAYSDEGTGGDFGDVGNI